MTNVGALDDDVDVPAQFFNHKSPLSFGSSLMVRFPAYKGHEATTSYDCHDRDFVSLVDEMVSGF